jgi:hypothetical protein
MALDRFDSEWEPRPVDGEEGEPMPAKPLPRELAQEWGKLKSQLVPQIQKLSGMGMTPEFKKDLTKKAESLYKQFDMGLRDKLKKASEAKSEAEVKQAVSNVFSVSQDYLKKVKAAKAQWGVNGNAVAETIEAKLLKIHDAAKKSLG